MADETTKQSDARPSVSLRSSQIVHDLVQSIIGERGITADPRPEHFSGLPFSCVLQRIDDYLGILSDPVPQNVHLCWRCAVRPSPAHISQGNVVLCDLRTIEDVLSFGTVIDMRGSEPRNFGP
jgi:hypothetical protein